MKKYSLFLNAAIIATIFLVVSCKGPQGDVGPAGSAGIAGPVGAIGSANVIYSDWISVNFTGSSPSYVGTITAPRITQEILDKGYVKTYFKNPSGLVNSLNFYQPNGTVLYSLWAYYTVGKINMSGQNYNPSSPTYSYRYIIVPGGTASGRKANIDYSDYNAVKAAYNLPD
jgi:hypothetical protein